MWGPHKGQNRTTLRPASGMDLKEVRAGYGGFSAPPWSWQHHSRSRDTDATPASTEGRAGRGMWRVWTMGRDSAVRQTNCRRLRRHGRTWGARRETNSARRCPYVGLRRRSWWGRRAERALPALRAVGVGRRWSGDTNFSEKANVGAPPHGAVAAPFTWRLHRAALKVLPTNTHTEVVIVCREGGERPRPPLPRRLLS